MAVAALPNIMSDLLKRFKVSIKDIRSYMGVSTSTVYRWLEQDDESISLDNYQKLLSLYCRLYLSA